MNWHRTAYLLAHDLIGSQLRRNYREFLAAERWSPQRLHEVHEARLSSLLRHARENVPYYRERAASPELSAFPVLRKGEVHDHFQALMEPSLLAEYRGERKKGRYSWVEVKTGGSTGTPTVVIHDKTFRDWGRAGRLYSQHLCGFPIGTPFFMLWGSMRDINEAKDALTKRVLNALLQVRTMNAFLMDEPRMRGYLQQLNESDIKHLMAYVDAADELARFAEKNSLRAPKLESIGACAGTVTEEHRARLGRVFGARIHNKYGSRECSDMACECAHGSIHIYATGVHLEIVDERDQPVPAGTSGRILVTLLHNRRFPLVRYEIGDIGAFKAGTCACGSPLPLLESIQGRISETITSATGAFISSVYIRHLVGVVHNPGALQRFQFVQHGESDYSLALQLEPAFSDEAFTSLASALRRDLEKVLDRGAQLQIRRVADLPPTASGKFLYVRNTWASR